MKLTERQVEATLRRTGFAPTAEPSAEARDAEPAREVSASWWDRRVLALDTETTGTGDDARIVEVGWAGLVDGGPLDGGSTWGGAALVNPGVPIPPEATAVHGIGDADVRDAPSLRDEAEKILALVRSADVLAGYNWPFDASMFYRELGEAWRTAIAGKPILDGLVVVRLNDVGRYWPGKGRHKLDAVCKRIGVEVAAAQHRAAGDALRALQVLTKLRGFFPADADEAATFILDERERQEADFAAWKARTAAAGVVDSGR